MSALFGKKPKEKTVLVVDVESGSVGSALVRLSPAHAPKLFGEQRIELSHSPRRSAEALAAAVAHAGKESVAHAGMVAARVRGHATASPMGQIERVVLFFNAPWSSAHFSGRDEFARPVVEPLQMAVEEHFGSVPVSRASFASAAAHGAHRLLPESSQLLCALGTELAELLLLDGPAVLGRATMPLGHSVLPRTAMAHGGLSLAEVRSALKLGGSPALEAFTVAGEHFAGTFAEVAEELLTQTQARAPSQVYMLGPEEESQWLAQALARHRRMGELFAGGVVRALRPHHISPHVAAHAPKPDLNLLIEALFLDSRITKY